MAFGIFSGFVAILTILAFMPIKSDRGMLYGAAITAWIIETFLLWNQSWPTANPYIREAATIFGIIMVIVMSAATLMYYLTWRRSKQPYTPTDEETQNAYRNQVYKITKKKSPWD